MASLPPNSPSLSSNFLVFDAHFEFKKSFTAFRTVVFSISLYSYDKLLDIRDPLFHFSGMDPPRRWGGATTSSILTVESLASLGNFGPIDTWLLYSLKQNSCPVRWLSFTSSKTSIACRRFIASLVRIGFVGLCDKDYLFVMMVCKRKGF